MTSAPESQVAAATAYETVFVPALFKEWAPVVADAAGLKPGDRVLDVACGSGVLAREAAKRVGGGAQVAGLDPHLGMLEVARHLSPAIEWHQGAAEALPFPDSSFDAVVCQFGLMFFTDRGRAVREMLRVMTSGGRCAVAVWDAIENIPAFATLVAMLDRMAGKDAGDALRAPFALGDRRKLAALFDDAGARSVVATTQRGPARFPSLAEFVEAEVRGWLPVMGVNLPETTISAILAEAKNALAAYSTPDGGAALDMSAHLVAARKA